jgi:hypothetical protein
MVMLMLTSFVSIAQNPKISFTASSYATNTRGGNVVKGDTLDIIVKYEANGNTSTRSLYFDFESQESVFDLIDVIMYAPGVSGGALPAGSSYTRDWYEYIGYSFVRSQQNTTTNGNTNYQYANYQFSSSSGKQITRVYTNISSTTPLVTGNFMKLRFRIKSTATGYNYDPVRMNFAAAYNNNGATGATEMVDPIDASITLDPASVKYITETIGINSNLDGATGGLRPKLLFQEQNTTSGQPVLFTINAQGKLVEPQTSLKPNTTYKVMMMMPMDSLYAIQKKAITISDYMSAQNEFVTQNIDGTFKNDNIHTGVGYFASDINNNYKLDGGDLTRLFASVIGADTLAKLPTQYTAGGNGYMSVPTMTDSLYNNLSTSNWGSYLQQNPAVVMFTTGYAAKPLSLKYILVGDVNRSHSSQVVQNNTIITNAKVSMSKTMYRTEAFINTTNNIPSINVSLNNLTVVSNNIEIPIKINAGSNKMAGVQFEIVYDPNKVKFEQIVSQLPLTWFTFVNNKSGVIRFGALDKEAKTPLSNEVTPFKLKFSTLQNGLDINSQIKITSNMDASDTVGNQLGINLNTTTIKLTGYNNF